MAASPSALVGETANAFDEAGETRKEREMAKPIDRRSFLGGAALGIGALGASALAGCSSGKTAAGTSAGAQPIASANIPEAWDRECDIVVIGSGSVLPAATYSALNGLETIVLEKNEMIGGTTITSGGKTWIPCTRLVEGDERDRALEFLTACNPHEFATPEQVQAYVDHGAEMAHFLMDEAGVNFQLFKSALVPAKTGFDDVHGVLGVPREDDPAKTTGSGFQQPQIDAITAAGGEILSSTPATRLVTRTLADGRQEVLGVIAESKGKELSIKARKGVIIGTGPYDHNPELCKQLLPYQNTYTWAIETCTGDGLLMALGAGAKISQTNRAWGIMPEIYGIDAIEAGETLPIYAQRADFAETVTNGVKDFTFTIAKKAPIVSRMGQRFYKEPGNYTTMWAWAGMDAREETDFEYRYTPYSFAIIDEATAVEAGYDKISPTPGWLTKGETFEELAANSGIDAFNFVNTMSRWQADAKKDGIDTEYGRTDIVALGDGPYYAVKCCQFHQTTVGGIAVNEKAQVLAAMSDIVPRLYASSTAASIGGIVYPSSGGSIGPGMVFAYIAAVDAAGLDDWE